MCVETECDIFFYAPKEIESTLGTHAKKKGCVRVEGGKKERERMVLQYMNVTTDVG